MQKMRAIMKRTIITVVGKDTVGIIAKVCTPPTICGHRWEKRF